MPAPKLAARRCVRKEGRYGVQNPPGGGPGGLRDGVASRSVVVVADVHPDVAPPERGHGRLPHVALVIRVVARLIDMRDGDAEDRGVEAMVPPDMALGAAVVDAVEVHLRLSTARPEVRHALDVPRRGRAAELRRTLEVPDRRTRSAGGVRRALVGVDGMSRTVR